MKKIKLKPTGFALVDEDDFGYLSKFRWYLSKVGYAIGGEKTKDRKSFEKMHRFIMGVTDPKIIIDHKDGIKLNNQRSNLRVATSQQNVHNSKKRSNTKNNYKGTFFVNKLGLWQSRCRMNGNDFYLGLFKSEIAAAYAYNKKAVELSEYSLINFLPHPLEYLEKILVTELVTNKAEVQSKYKHIFFKKKADRMKCGKWYIRFYIEGKPYYKGYFLKEDDALNYLKNNYSNILITAGDEK